MITNSSLRTPPAALNDLSADTRARFVARYGREPEWMVAAPGRVNLIGEHVDYNEGFVLPMAIERWTVMAGGRNGTMSARVASGAEEEPAEIALDVVPEHGPPAWSQYVRGVIAGFRRRGIEFEGFDAEVQSSLPVGGGLSSSAALEVAMATLLECASGESLEPEDKARLCQAAEHEFPGVPCGIMDQFTSALGRKDRLLLLDCRSQRVELIPFESDEVAILIANTNVSHELTDGGYAARRDQCEEATEYLLVASLRDVSPEALERARGRMDDAVYRRARHVVSEIERTQQAAKAIVREDWAACGELMFGSHDSLRDDYEVSCRELDVFVEIARSLGLEGGVYGCRMTGAGFGGCTVSLVRADAVARVMAAYDQGYREATGIEPAIFSTRAAEGARVLPPGKEEAP